MAKTEKELIIEFQDALRLCDETEEAFKKAKEQKDRCEHALLEHLEQTGAEKTATYEGIGHVTRMKPRLYASCNKENEDLLFAFLCANDREDLIKRTVHSSSLSSLVKERIESGEEVPEFISYYLKPSARMYSAE